MIKISKRQQIDSHDWDRLVVETYGKPYIFQQQEGCQERGTVIITVPDEKYDYDSEMYDEIPEEINGPMMGVKFRKWLERDVNEWNGDEDDRRFLKLFWHRNFYPDIHVVANDLYKKGLLPPGEYDIKIDW